MTQQDTPSGELVLRTMAMPADTNANIPQAGRGG
jgi:acyl-CoA thioesterase YciA